MFVCRVWECVAVCYVQVCLPASHPHVWDGLVLDPGDIIKWKVKRWFLKQTSRWQYFSGLFTLPPCCWLQSCWSTMWGWSRRVPPPLRQTARSGPTISAGARIGGRYWATAGTWLSSTPSSSRDSLTMGCSGTPRAPGDWRRQRTDEIRKALAAWLKGPTIDGSSGSQYYQVQ